MRLSGVYLLFCGFNMGFSKVYGRVCTFQFFERSFERSFSHCRFNDRSGRKNTGKRD